MSPESIFKASFRTPKIIAYSLIKSYLFATFGYNCEGIMCAYIILNKTYADASLAKSNKKYVINTNSCE